MNTKKIKVLITLLILLLLILIKTKSFAAEDITIQFNDLNFLNQVRWQYTCKNIDTENLTLTMDKDVVDSIKKMTIENVEITDFTGLEKFENINTLTITFSNCEKESTLNIIKNMTNLTNLNLRGNELGNSISALGSLTSLKKLYLENNHISDITAIGNLTNLETLDLANNIIKDISPLENLTNLKQLYLSTNVIEDIAPISGLSNLVDLNISTNRIENIDALSNLSGLKKIILSNNRITDISALKNFTTLDECNLYGNKIENLSVLKNNTGMTKLYIGNTGISDITEIVQNMSNLINFDFQQNSVENIDVLRNLRKIKKMNMSNNKITDISAIENLPDLVELRAFEQKIVVYANIGDTITLPNIFAQSKNTSSKIHSNEDYELSNVSLNGNSFTFNGEKSTVKIADGYASDTELIVVRAGKNDPNDNTTADGELPYAGIKIGIGVVSAVVILAVFYIVKLHKYKDI